MTSRLRADPALPADLAALLREILRRLEALERRQAGGSAGG